MNVLGWLFVLSPVIMLGSVLIFILYAISNSRAEDWERASEKIRRGEM